MCSGHCINHIQPLVYQVHLVFKVNNFEGEVDGLFPEIQSDLVESRLIMTMQLQLWEAKSMARNVLFAKGHNICILVINQCKSFPHFS